MLCAHNHRPPSSNDKLPPPFQSSPSVRHPQPRSPLPSQSPDHPLSFLSSPTLCHKDSSPARRRAGGNGGGEGQHPGAVRPTPAHPSAAHSAGPQASGAALHVDGMCRASPNSLLLHLFHFLSSSDDSVDDFLLLICQLFLLPLSVGLTAGMDGPACLEPER